MIVEIIPCLQDNYSYLIIDESNNDACVIDPSEAKPIINFIENNKINLKYILNTHHHYDHVGGNLELKKKYSSTVVGFEGDKDRIPEIDILVKDNQVWKANNFEAKIIHIPGHTTGHIGYYFINEKIIFTGDTLFSLGCGRIFEGTFEQMFSSIKKIKKLPKDTKIYCGHEYTKSNYEFCKTFDTTNKELPKKKLWIEDRIKKGLPTIPVTLEEECNTNIFLRCDNIALKKELKMEDSSEVLVFQRLRNLKDQF